MTPNLLRRAATVVALSALVLGQGAAAAQADHGKPAPKPSVTAGPTASPTPTPTPTPTPSSRPTLDPRVGPTPTSAPTRAPAPDPTATADPAPVTVPVVDVLPPRCEGTTTTPGSITVTPVPGVAWIVVEAGTEPEDDSGVVAGPALGEPGGAEVAAGAYDVYAIPLDGQWGDLGAWQVTHAPEIRLSVTVSAAPCSTVAPTPTPTPAPAPSAAAWTPSDEQLTSAARGGFTTAARASAGAAVTLRGLPAGAAVRAYLFSVPTDLGAATVAADGTLKVTIPASVSAGTHRVAVYRADGTLLGWQYVEVLASGDRLAATGSEPRALALGALVLVGAGGALLAARRRTAGTRG